MTPPTRIVVFSLLCVTAQFAVAEIDTGKISESVVILKVSGNWVGRPSTDVKTNVGTGFYVSDAGFIMTAAHLFDAKQRPTDGDVKWECPPTIEITYMDGNIRDVLLASESSLIYIDKQTDLALVGTALKRPALDLRVAPSLYKTQKIYVVAFGPKEDRQSPNFPDGTVDSPVNFSNQFRGMIDINVSGLGESDSGSPVLDEEGRVIGIFVGGEKYSSIGQVAVPIAFSAPLLGIAGIAYPPPISFEAWLSQDDYARIVEVESALVELKAEVETYGYQFIERQSIIDLKVSYGKRLAAGFHPSSVSLLVRLIGGGITLEHDIVADVQPNVEGSTQSKQGIAVVRNFNDKLRIFLENKMRAGTISFPFTELDAIEIVPTAQFNFLEQPQWPQGPTTPIDWPPDPDKYYK